MAQAAGLTNVKGVRSTGKDFLDACRRLGWKIVCVAGVLGPEFVNAGARNIRNRGARFSIDDLNWRSDTASLRWMTLKDVHSAA